MKNAYSIINTQIIRLLSARDELVNETHSFRMRIGKSLDICVCGLSSVSVGCLRRSVCVGGGRGCALLELVLEARAHQLKLVVL